MKKKIVMMVLGLMIGFFAVQSYAAEEPLKIGWAEIDITPPGTLLPIDLRGQMYARLTSNVNDPLTATALAIESDSGEQWILVSIDTIDLGPGNGREWWPMDHEGMLVPLRNSLQGVLVGFDLNKLTLVATHTHTAPYLNETIRHYYPSQEPVQNNPYYDFVKGKLEEVVQRAWNARSYGGISFAKGEAAVGFCRIATYTDGTHQMYGSTTRSDFAGLLTPYDHTLELMYATDANGSLTGVMINIISPSQVVEHAEYLSADFWFDVKQQLRQTYGNEIFILPYSGAAGDMSPHNLQASSATREEIGAMIADSVREQYPSAMNSIKYQVEMRHLVRNVNLTTKGYYHNVHPVYDQSRPSYLAEIHALRLDNMAWVNNPFELYNDWGKAIQNRSLATQTIIAQMSGLNRGGYLPTEEAVIGGAYGGLTENGWCDHIGGQELVDNSVDMINSLFQSDAAPTARDDSVNTDEGVALTIDVLSNDSDPDGDTLYVISVTQPVNGSVVINGNDTVTYAPIIGFSGNDSFTYTISDGDETDTATVTVNVRAFVDTIPPVITLIGSDPVDIVQGTAYIDSSATATDNVDGDISADIVTVNPVDTSTIGTYTVTYDITDAAGNAAQQVTRTVNVVAPPVDTTPPVITLLGSVAVNVVQGETYTDAGATATDNIDGDISADIVTVNPVDSNTVGSYTVTYDVSDAAGNAAQQVTRTVNVVAPPIDTTPPVITLLGSVAVNVLQGDAYIDPGATATDNIDGDISADIVTANPVDSNTVGSYTITYDVTDAAGNAAQQVTRSVNVITPSATIIAINAGGDAYISADGTEYRADQYFSGGQTHSTNTAIAGTDDDLLYQTERYGNPTYAVPVDNATYEVTVGFAEIYFNDSSEIDFDVVIEDVLAAESLDVWEQVGKNRAYDVTAIVTVSDGVLNIEANNIKAITISEVSALTADFTFSSTDLTVDFSDNSSDSDGTIVSRAWDFGDASSSNATNPSHSYSAAGTYTVTLTVTDNDGLSDSISQEVTVTAQNVSPTASFTFSSTDLTVDFSDNSSDSDGTIVSRVWDFGDASSSNATNPSHSYSAAGTYTVTLTVTDDDGLSDSSSQEVTVTAQNMTPTASFTFSSADLTANFSDNSSDSDGTIVSRAWDFGDASSSNATNPSHSYSAAGTYTVTLTVTDDDGLSDSISQDVVVVDSTSLPPAAPSNLTADVQRSGTGQNMIKAVTLSWVDNVNNLGVEYTFIIERCQLEGKGNKICVYVEIASVPSTETTFSDEAGSGKFQYRVVAINVNGRSEPSNSVKI